MLKHARKVLIIFIFIITNAVAILLNDANEKSKFFSMDNRNYKVVYIEYNEAFSKETFKDFFLLANKNDVILLKNEMQYIEGTWANNVFISLDNINSIVNYLDINYSIISNQSIEYATSKLSNTKPANVKINDFLNNDYYNIYTMDSLITDNKHLFADYLVYYKDEAAFNSFINDAKAIFGNGIEITENEAMDFNQIQIIAIGVIIFIIAIIMYMIIEVFYIYNQSKKISVMQLLGLSNNKIFLNIVKKEVVLYGITALFFLLLMFFTLPNIQNDFFFNLVLLNTMIVAVFCILSYISILIISSFYKVVDLLKNNQIINRLLVVGSGSKIVLNCLFIIVSIITLTSANSYFNQGQQMQDMKEFSNYAFFNHVNTANGQYKSDDHSNLNTLYLLLLEEGIDMQYIEYAQYEVYDEKDINYTNKSIEMGEYYPIINVNAEYLKKNKINIYDSNKNNITFEEQPFERFIFPKGYEKYYDSFLKFYQGVQIDNEHIKSDFTLYTYDYKSLPTYNVDRNKKTYVHSNLILKEPIIRVIYSEYPINYIDDMYGLSIAGIGSDTALKINVGGDKLKSYQEIFPLLQKANVEQLLTIDSFVTLGELLNNEFLNMQLIFYIEGFALILIFIIYAVLSFELNCLLIEKQKKSIMVQTFLGAKNIDIYKSVFYSNVVIMLLSIIVVAIIHLFFVPIINFSFIVVIFAMITYEIITTLMTVRRISLDNIILLIKGEE